MTQSFFTLWFENINKFSRVHDKKLVIVALCALIELPVEQLPHTLQAGWSQVLDGILAVFKTLPKAEEGKFMILLLFIYSSFLCAFMFAFLPVHFIRFHIFLFFPIERAHLEKLYRDFDESNDEDSFEDLEEDLGR